MFKVNQVALALVVGSALVATSLFGYAYLNYRYKMEVLNKETQAKATRDQKLKQCQWAAEADYTDYWNAQCKVQGLNKKTDDCSLPKYIADDVEARREKALDGCIKLYSAN